MTDEKKKDDLIFQNLTEHDLLLIHEMAKNNFLNQKDTNVVSATIQAVFACIHAKGMNIVKDPDRKSTWSEPNSTWYIPYIAPKTDWSK